MISLCNQWEFVKDWNDTFAQGEGTGEAVRLPHTVQELPLHYADHNSYQMLCGYRRKLDLGQELEGKHVFLQFDGAAHVATVYLNGVELTTHRCGYTAFRVEITEAARLGGENLLAVKLDTTENAAIPPFGFVIDYLTYGGLYRDVNLICVPESHFDLTYYGTHGIKVTPVVDGANANVEVEVFVKNAKMGQYLQYTVLDAEGAVSMNFWGFTPSMLHEMETRFPAFLDQALAENPMKGEYFLPGVVDQLIQEGKADVRVLKSLDRWYGVTYKEDKPQLMAKIEALIADGVYPRNLWK